MTRSWWGIGNPNRTPRKFTSGLHRRNGGKENCTLIRSQPHRFNRYPAEGKIHGISSFNSRSIGSNACPRDLVKPKRYTFCVRAWLMSIKYFLFTGIVLPQCERPVQSALWSNAGMLKVTGDRLRKAALVTCHPVTRSSKRSHKNFFVYFVTFVVQYDYKVSYLVT